MDYRASLLLFHQNTRHSFTVKNTRVFYQHVPNQFIYIYVCVCVTVVPHKAVAEVSE